MLDYVAGCMCFLLGEEMAQACTVGRRQARGSSVMPWVRLCWIPRSHTLTPTIYLNIVGAAKLLRNIVDLASKFTRTFVWAWTVQHLIALLDFNTAIFGQLVDRIQRLPDSMMMITTFICLTEVCGTTVTTSCESECQNSHTLTQT